MRCQDDPAGSGVDLGIAELWTLADGGRFLPPWVARPKEGMFACVADPGYVTFAWGGGFEAYLVGRVTLRAYSLIWGAVLGRIP